MVAEPTLIAVTTPSDIVATEASEVLQVTVLSVASSGFTVAVRVTVSPTFKEALVLSRVIEATGVASTVIAQVASLSPALAVMVAVPSLMAVTTPSSTVAMDTSEVLQVTVLSVASSGFTVALRVTVSPTFKEALVLSKLIEDTSTTPLLTVTTQDPIFPPAVAVMVDVPSAIATTFPFCSTVATDCFDDAHIISRSVAFEGEIVALNEMDSPTIISAAGWLTVTEDTGISCSFSEQDQNTRKVKNAMENKARSLFISYVSLLPSVPNTAFK